MNSLSLFCSKNSVRGRMLLRNEKKKMAKIFGPMSVCKGFMLLADEIVYGPQA